MLGERSIECPASLLAAGRGTTPMRTAIVNAINDVALESARDATLAGLIEPVLVGAPEAIRAAAEKIGWDIGVFEIIEGVGEDGAAAAAASAAGKGRVQALMKGHLHTDSFMKAVLNKDAGLRMGVPFTHASLLTVPGRAGSLVISDGALNPAPDVELRKAIIKNAIVVQQALGIVRPKVALLSATEVMSPRIPSTTESAELARWAKTGVPDADVDGPLAFDLCVSPEAVRIKGIDSPVAGRADIIIVPEIVSGNALMKTMIQLMGACLAGVVMGAKVPIILTSRADAPAARLASTALAAALAKHAARAA